MCSLNVAFRLRHESVRTGRMLGLECFTGTGFGLTRALTLVLSIINQTLVPIHALSLQRPSSSARGWEAKDGRNQKYRKGSQRTEGISRCIKCVSYDKDIAKWVFVCL